MCQNLYILFWACMQRVAGPVALDKAARKKSSGLGCFVSVSALRRDEFSTARGAVPFVIRQFQSWR